MVVHGQARRQADTHTRLFKQVLDLLLLGLDVLLQRVEFLAHDAVLALKAQAGLAFTCQADLHACADTDPLSYAAYV